MADNAKVSMILSRGLHPNEEVALKAIEADIVKILFQQGVTDRLIWTTDEHHGGRFVHLRFFAAEQERKALVEVPASDVIALRPRELLSRLVGELGRNEGRQ